MNFGLALLASVVLNSQAASDVSVVGALRLGVGLPAGDIGEGAPMDRAFDALVPISFDLGLRFHPQLTIGAFLHWAPLLCHEEDEDQSISFGPRAAPVNCSATDYRFGIEAIVRMTDDAAVSPWFGLGVGYEILTVDLSQGVQRRRINYRGLEYVNLQLGVELPQSPSLSFGPYLAYSLGVFDSVAVDGSDSVDIGNEKRKHQWLQVGLRMAFDVGAWPDPRAASKGEPVHASSSLDRANERRFDPVAN